MLKILYASEEEKVQVNNDGTLIVSNANAAPVEATEQREAAADQDQEMLV